MPLGVVRNTAWSGVRFLSEWCLIPLGVISIPLGVVGDTARSGSRCRSEWCSIPLGVVSIPLAVVVGAFRHLFLAGSYGRYAGQIGWQLGPSAASRAASESSGRTQLEAHIAVEDGGSCDLFRAETSK